MEEKEIRELKGAIVRMERVARELPNSKVPGVVRKKPWNRFLWKNRQSKRIYLNNESVG